VSPDRIYDTRTGQGGAPIAKVNGGASAVVKVAGVAGVPADATAVALNVTATNQQGAGFLTVYPTGGAVPNVSNVNIPAEAKDVANAVAVQVGSGGQVTVRNSNNPVDVIVDVVGYWSEGSGDLLTAIATPTRIFDTRDGTGTTAAPIGEGEVRDVQVTGGVVPSGATGVVANVTATNGTRGGFLTVSPDGSGDTSSVNFLPGTNVPNLVFAPIDPATGKIRVRNAFGNTDVIVDVIGYFGGGTAGADALAAMSPDRILDTRSGIGGMVGKVDANGVVTFKVRGEKGVDASGDAVLLNVTVNEPDQAGYLTVFPEGSVPNASNVNFAPRQTVANLVLARIGSDGSVRIANTSPGASYVIGDVFAWFGEPSA
jgi:hypothetical protein